MHILYMPFFTTVGLVLTQGITIQSFEDSNKKRKFHICLTEKRNYVTIYLSFIYLYYFIKEMLATLDKNVLENLVSPTKDLLP